MNKNLEYMLNTELAITNDALDSMLRINVDNIKAEVLSSRGVRNNNGIAIIDIIGPIMSGYNFISNFIDTTEINDIRENINAAINDPKIDGILLNINSPGGVVTGVSELAGTIYQARNIKPIIAYISGIGASAAYWIASAANEVIIADTGLAGSIGVITSAYRKSDETIEVISSVSPKKSLDPGTQEGIDAIQARVDAIADVFVESVAKNRGVSTQDVISKYGAGGVLVGKYAVIAGLADKIGTFDGAMREFKTNSNLGGFTMQIETVQQLTDSYPALVGQIKSDAQAEVDVKSAVDIEVDRILGLASIQFGEDGDKFKKIVQSGVTVDQFRAISDVTIVAAQSVTTDSDAAVKEEMLKAIQDSGADNPGHESQKKDVPADFNAAVKHFMDNDKMSRAQAIRATVEAFPDLHAKYIEQQR